MHYDVSMHRNALMPKPYIHWAFGEAPRYYVPLG
ncbi:hypothetical protein PCL1391_3193 [Pseudomonas chlororaphis subsp. piscium]|nr:hypothetical protein PCL1391_3193 [Pseudomonas chlororaphis subsp. piscium]